MAVMTASQARQQLFPLIERVVKDHTPIRITSKHGTAVLVSEADWEASEETAYLLGTPANATWLAESLAQAARGEAEEHDLLDA